jgi:hypothetical protein
VPAAPRFRTLLALALVTGTTLAYQVALTRLLASVLAYHYSFLAISIALLGTGAGALALYIWPRTFLRRRLRDALCMWAAIYAVFLFVTPLLLVQLDLSDSRGVDAKFIANLVLACVIASPAAFASGVVVALAIRGYAAHVGRVYAYDLVGAGLGAFLIVPALSVDDAPTLLAVLGLIAAAAAVLFAERRSSWRRVAVAVAAGGLVLVMIAETTSLLYLDPRYNQPGRVADRWGPLSRVVGYRLPDPARQFDLMFYDRVFAPVPVVRGDDLPNWADLGLGPQSIAYQLTGPGQTLVIGGGGGRDIYNALSSGQRVDVIELNRDIERVVDDDLGGDSGHPYSRPGVHTTIGDGRSVLSRRDKKYDVIHIGFTDTLSANSAQGFALTENNLYTTEAFQEYFDHLAPDGFLVVTRLRKLVGEEALRATVLTLQALEERGVAHPERNVVVVRGHDVLPSEFETVIASTRPFTAAQLDEVRRLATERGDGIVYAPDGPYVGEWAELAQARSPGAFCSSYHLDVCAPTDDKPFFFNMKRIGDFGSKTAGFIYSVDPYDLLLVTAAILVALCALGFVLPLAATRKRLGRPRAGSLVYFAAIGLGFLLVEIVMVQRLVLFLGFPTYALSVVLFALLIFSGVGSAISPRLPDPRRTLPLVLAGAVAVVVVSGFGFGSWLREMISLPFGARVVIASALIAPIGVVLGMAMPMGLGRFRGLYPDSVAYAWGVNGIASVLASVLGVVLVLGYGFVIASLVAAGCYGVALLHAVVGRWPARDAPPAEVTDLERMRSAELSAR